MEVSEKIEELEKNLKVLSDKRCKEGEILISHNNEIRKHESLYNKYRKELKRVSIAIEILKRGVKKDLIGPEVSEWKRDALEKHRKFKEESKNKDFKVGELKEGLSQSSSKERPNVPRPNRNPPSQKLKEETECVHEWNHEMERGFSILRGGYFYKVCKLCGKEQVT